MAVPPTSETLKMQQKPLKRWATYPSSLEEADAVIVNTCAVTEKTERKILRRLSLLQGKRLVVAGCLVHRSARIDSPDKLSGSTGPAK